MFHMMNQDLGEKRTKMSLISIQGVFLIEEKIESGIARS
jgi:hypothetical protein